MRLFFLTALCLTLFASNSILCRAALVTWGMEPLQYTAIRSLSAAAMLALLCLAGVIGRKEASAESRGPAWRLAWRGSSWAGALSLFGYMICFSLGYVNIPSADGTLIINMSVQLAMVGWGLVQGIVPGRKQIVGLAVACAGLAMLMAPGLSAPPLVNSLLMMGSGISWGIYSLVGRKAGSAALATAGNFMRCIPLGAAAAVLALAFEHAPQLPAVLCALGAGALASALGYILWYAIVGRYTLVSSSIIQLSVPLITALLGVAILGESITLRLVVCGALIIGGIVLGILEKGRAK